MKKKVSKCCEGTAIPTKGSYMGETNHYCSRCGKYCDYKEIEVKQPEPNQNRL